MAQESLIDIPGERRRRAEPAQTSKGIGAGDIVLVDKKGRRFHALVTELEQLESGRFELVVRPLDSRISYRTATVREVIEVWRKARRRVGSAHARPVQRQLPQLRPRTVRARSRAPRPAAAGRRPRPPGARRQRRHRAADRPRAAGPDADHRASGITGMRQYNERAYAHFQAGRYEQAIADWAEAFKLHPISTFLRDQGDALRAPRALRGGREDVRAVPRRAAHDRRRRATARASGSCAARPSRRARTTTSRRSRPPARLRRGGDWFSTAARSALPGPALQPRPPTSFRQANQSMGQARSSSSTRRSALEAGEHKRAAANAYEHYLVRPPRRPKHRGQDPRQDQAAGAPMRPRKVPTRLIDPEDEPSEMPIVSLARAERRLTSASAAPTVAWKLGDFHRAYDALRRRLRQVPRCPSFVLQPGQPPLTCWATPTPPSRLTSAISRSPRGPTDVPKVRKRIATPALNPSAVGPRDPRNGP